MTPDIEIRDLAKSFRTWRKGRVDALKGISFSVARGEVFGFLGPNGAGKSTTIKLLMGLLRPGSGQTLLLGRPSNEAANRKEVGYLPENPALFDYLTGAQYLSMVGRIRGMDPATIRRRSDEVLERLSLVAARNRSIRGYSKGMVQRLGLAQALLSEPQVLVLDEPMSGLDPLGRALVKEIIVDLKAAGHTVFFSTHITSDVESVCDRVAILNRGELKGLFEVSSLLVEGLKGYRIHLRQRHGGQTVAEVDCAGLESALRRLAGEGATVLLVEPQRKSLEEVFLTIVGQKA